MCTFLFTVAAFIGVFWSFAALALAPLNLPVDVNVSRSLQDDLRVQGTLAFSTTEADVATLSYDGGTLNIKDPSIKALREAHTNPGSFCILTLGPQLGIVLGHAKVPSVVRIDTNALPAISVADGRPPIISTSVFTTLFSEGKFVPNAKAESRLLNYVESIATMGDVANARPLRVVFPTREGYRSAYYGGQLPNGNTWVVESQGEQSQDFLKNKPGTYQVREIDTSTMAIYDAKKLWPDTSGAIGPSAQTQASLIADMFSVARNVPLPNLPDHINPSSATYPMQFPINTKNLSPEKQAQSGKPSWGFSCAQWLKKLWRWKRE